MEDKTPEKIALERIKKAAKMGAKELDLSSIGGEYSWNNGTLTSIPAEIGKLTQLTSLNISNNEINQLPSEIGKLVNLKVLNASFNKLTGLPNEIGNLLSLEELDLAFNKLKKLPETIGDLVNLRRLYLGKAYYFSLGKSRTENRLEALPKRMTQLINLQELDLDSNPLPIPPEIIKKRFEPDKILKYYFSIVDQVQRKLNETKVLVVGQGSVGKTSLIKHLIYNEFNSQEAKTEGISINRLDIEFVGKNKKQKTTIRVNIWDFGGQEIMHATHQFFLTKRSLYVLVLDSRLTQEENRVEYWLKIIQSFGGESPVLIVGNKIDQHPLDIDRTGLQKKYPNIVGVLETSAATGAGMGEFKNTISKQVKILPHIHDLLPETWFTVKTKLEELGRQSNFITHDKYLDLCAENEVSDETSQRTLIGFLHDLGVVLHFQDDPRLEALGILNPQWVTNGVYKILNSHTLFQNKGVLTTSMLDEILNLPEYPRGKRLFIVDMMKKFELCYDIEADKTFLVPDLLPKDEPVTDGRENALAFQYHYMVLPSSVITRFIVRMNEYAQEKVWRSGVVLKDGGNTALVKADIEDRKIFIWVSGDEHKRHDFLSKIRGQFDAIHKTITRLDAKEMVPVPGHPEAEPVGYDLLLQMDHNNVDVYPVLSNGKMIVVNVKAMLNGVARELDRQRNNVTNFYIGGDVKDSTIIAGDDNEVNKK